MSCTPKGCQGTPLPSIPFNPALLQRTGIVVVELDWWKERNARRCDRERDADVRAGASSPPALLAFRCHPIRRDRPTRPAAPQRGTRTGREGHRGRPGPVLRSETRPAVPECAHTQHRRKQISCSQTKLLNVLLEHAELLAESLHQEHTRHHNQMPRSLHAAPPN